MARNVCFVPDGSNPTCAVRRGFYERPPASGGALAAGEADQKARSTPCPPGDGSCLWGPRHGAAVRGCASAPSTPGCRARARPSGQRRRRACGGGGRRCATGAQVRRFLPFATGPRSCPGRPLAEVSAAAGARAPQHAYLLNAPAVGLSLLLCVRRGSALSGCLGALRGPPCWLRAALRGHAAACMRSAPSPRRGGRPGRAALALPLPPGQGGAPAAPTG
jgi:hypothetical protein